MRSPGHGDGGSSGGAAAPPGPQLEGDTYMDGAITKAVHNTPVTSLCLCAGQWPDPNCVGWDGDTEVSLYGDHGESHCAPAPGRSKTGPHCIPEPSTSPLTSAPLSSVSLCLPQGRPAPLWGSFVEQGAVGHRVPPGWGTCPQAPQGPGQRGPQLRCAHAVLLSSLCPGAWQRTE